MKKLSIILTFLVVLCNSHYLKAQCYAGFNYEIDTSYNLTVNFINYSTESPNMKYLWEFGDGSVSRSKNPVHKYNIVSEYDVYLTISDSVTNCKNKNGLRINVLKCRANFETNVDIDKRAVTFINKSSSNTTNYLWQFGDGKTSTHKNPTHVYNETGLYKPSLTVYDSNTKCIDTTGDYIYLFSCYPFFTPAIDTNQKFKLFLINKSSSNSNNRYKWSFGDGSFSNLKNPTHRYTKFGKFIIYLTIIDSSKSVNCTNTFSDTIGLDANGKLLKADSWELVVIDETVFGISKIIKSDFKIYPNPANTKVTIDVSNSTQHYEKIEILNANGQICMVQQIEKGNETIDVDLEHINPGLYLIKLSNDNGYSISKMMKN